MTDHYPFTQNPPGTDPYTMTTHYNNNNQQTTYNVQQFQPLQNSVNPYYQNEINQMNQMHSSYGTPMNYSYQSVTTSVNTMSVNTMSVPQQQYNQYTNMNQSNNQNVIQRNNPLSQSQPNYSNSMNNSMNNSLQFELQQKQSELETLHFHIQNLYNLTLKNSMEEVYLFIQQKMGEINDYQSLNEALQKQISELSIENEQLKNQLNYYDQMIQQQPGSRHSISVTSTNQLSNSTNAFCRPPPQSNTNISTWSDYSSQATSTPNINNQQFIQLQQENEQHKKYISELKEMNDQWKEYSDQLKKENEKTKQSMEEKKEKLRLLKQNNPLYEQMKLTKWLQQSNFTQNIERNTNEKNVLKIVNKNVTEEKCSLTIQCNDKSCKILLIHSQNELKNRRYILGKIIKEGNVTVEIPKKGKYHICCYSNESLENKDCISFEF